MQEKQDNNHDKVMETVGRFSDPVSLRNKLIFASMYIAVFECFKGWMVENVKYLYWSGFENGKDIFRGYDENVLSKVKKNSHQVINGTLFWLMNCGAISMTEKSNFVKYTDIRNDFGHEMFGSIISGDIPQENYESYYDMLALFRKVVLWWINEIEIPTNDMPDGCNLG